MPVLESQGFYSLTPRGKMTDRTELLRSMFSDPRFVQIAPFLWHADIDGVKIGVLTVTLSPGFFEYALNLGAEERLLKAKAKGKINEAYAVLTRTSSGLRYCGHREAEEFHRQWQSMGLQVRSGKFGPFVTLPGSLTESDDDVM
jgi:hypothetical protein